MSSITSETRNNVTTTYEYDAMGQLIRVNDPNDTTSGTTGTTWVYSYDRGGNILSKMRYAYTTGTLGTALQSIPYVYGDSNWKDKLTSYNGATITYDAIGNPLTDGTWTYTWGAGRQLRQMSKAGMTVQFKYDHNGLRTQKIVTENGVTTTTNYTLRGKLLTHMTSGVDTLHFFYDANSRPAKVKYNGTMYTYVHNLQGDIVGIVDSTGALVVEYKYDAWGRPLSVEGSLKTTLGAVNPFRYRGYVYDEETGLDYLRSRYYNCYKNRFLNADELIANTQSSLYCYVRNAPIIHCDHNGLLHDDSTSINVYLDRTGSHWMISIFDVIFSFEGPSDAVCYTSIVFYNPKNEEISTILKENYEVLTIADVPKNVAMIGLSSIEQCLKINVFCNFEEIFDLNYYCFPTGQAKSEPYESKYKYIFESRPCAAFVDFVLKSMGIHLSRIWASPYLKDHLEYKKKNKSSYLFSKYYLTLIGEIKSFSYSILKLCGMVEDV